VTTARLGPTAVLAAGTFLAACTVGPEYRRPQTEVGANFARAAPPEDGAREWFRSGSVEAEWWRSFDVPVLDELLRRAVEANLDIRIAEANLRASRALLGIERRDRFPTATARASAEREQTSEARFAPNIERTETYYAAGLDASWEIDLFGRVRRAVEAASAEYEAAEADRRGVAVAVAGELARAYVELTGTRRRLEVARANVANQEESLKLVRALLDAGRGTELDLERARAQLETTRARLPRLDIVEARAMHRIAVLVGERPTALEDLLDSAGDLPSLLDGIAIADPAALLRRRPDIAAAERRLAASTARIGVATADLFPRISLNGSFGALATSPDDLADSEFRATSFGPFLQWAAFDLGRVRDRIDAREAETDAALARYEKTVLTALEETENSLVRVDRAHRRQAYLIRAERAADRAAELARERYGAGLDSFLAVLDAESRRLTAQDERVQGATDTGEAYVDLYVSLGGGW